MTERFTAECVGGPRHGEVVCSPSSTFIAYRPPHPDCKAAHAPVKQGHYDFVTGYIADRAIWRWMGWDL